MVSSKKQSRSKEARDKYTSIKTAMEAGRLQGEVYGKIPVLSPIFGAIKGWCSGVMSLLRSDLCE